MAGQHTAGPFHPDNPLTETREQTMTELGTELFDAIRRDHRAGERPPSSLAARDGVDRLTGHGGDLCPGQGAAGGCWLLPVPRLKGFR
ncbi:hypothetical protein [Streptomyces brasiliensis]|uniref:Uncharacterized protein n=1 Tax=Streptomyces brasiliensis TaxID=1954 RepID=A0A917UJY0_9ACTN|nr:hypothetical protein [Streptomyces brasiliensis]GGJ62001.1 hypothetical protein GCM10010121_085760 [Streptomyces brasiliensis]